jgi:hypothetical protein
LEERGLDSGCVWPAGNREGEIADEQEMGREGERWDMQKKRSRALLGSCR